MNIVLDVIILGIIIFCVYSGYRKGLIKTVMGIASFIIAFIMALRFSPPLSDFMYSKWIQPNLVSGLSKRIDDILGNVSLDRMVDDPARPDAFTNLIKDYGAGIPDVKEWITGGASSENLAANLVEPVAKGISGFIAFAAVLIVSIILIKIIAAIINGIVKLPVLNFANKAAGAAAGGIYGIVLSYIAVILIYYVLPYLAANTPIASAGEVMDDTFLFRWFFNTLPVKF